MRGSEAARGVGARRAAGQAAVVSASERRRSLEHWGEHRRLGCAGAWRSRSGRGALTLLRAPAVGNVLPRPCARRLRQAGPLERGRRQALRGDGVMAEE